MKKWLIAVLFIGQLSAREGLHRELVKGSNSTIPVCLEVADNPSEKLAAIAPLLRFNLNLSGIIDIKIKDQVSACPNHILITENESMLGSKYIALSYHGSQLNQIPKHRIGMPEISDAEHVNNFANQIASQIYKRITNQEGWFHKKIAFIETLHVNGVNEYHLKVANIDGTSPQILLNSPTPLLHPLFSEDGKHIAITQITPSGTKILMKNKKGPWHTITEKRGMNLASSWSPDSRYLLLVNHQINNPSIVSYDTLTAHFTPIMNGWSLDCDPVWYSNDHIYLTSSRSGSPQIYRYQLQKKLLERITFIGNGNESPSLSLATQKMAYIRRIEDEYQLLVHQFNGKTKHFKILSSTFLQDPRISDDGAWTLITEREGRRTVIGLVANDGSTHLRLIANHGQVKYPTWVTEKWSENLSSL